MAKKRRGHLAAPDRATRPAKAKPRGAPFPKGNKLGLATRYQAGASWTGNAGGIPKDVREYRELIRLRVPVMLGRLDDLLHHGTEDGVKFAIREVNLNAFPRPVQAIELAGPDGGAIAIKAELTSDEKRKRAAALIAAAAARAAKKKPDDGG